MNAGDGPEGYLALVLHAHLPFVRHPEYPSFLEEDWLFEAIVETYVPLLRVFERLEREGINFRLTLGMTPTLCEMLSDPLLQERCSLRLARLREFADAEVERTRTGPDRMHRTACMYLENLAAVARTYEEEWGRDLVAAFRGLQDRGRIDILTCAATHGFLPLLGTVQSVRAQLRVAVANYEKHFGVAPEGVWLPECGYAVGLDEELAAVGLRYFFLDSHGILYGTPRPKYGVYAPVICRSGVAAFGRDIESSRQVWSSTCGYPGDPDYREFYRDAGFDAPMERVGHLLHEGGHRHNIGIKYHRITHARAPLNEKDLYDPECAAERAAEHAGNFMFNRQAQSRFLRRQLGRPPLILSPYDAELFGHWWYEGPQFLEALIRRIEASQEEIVLTTPGEHLRRLDRLQVVRPSPSSWGDKGYFEVWLNGSNDWIYRHLHKAEIQMVQHACALRNATGSLERALNQAARELMLAQSSDWAFIMTTGTMSEYAEKRTREHIERFYELEEMIRTNAIGDERLAVLEERTNIFPEMSFRVYCD
jgi:1,4-alpha-glucan branching enzyme